MKSTDKINKLINNSDVQTKPETDKRILADALQHLEKLKQQKPAKTGPNIWRTITEAKAGKLSAAAVIFIVFGIGFSIGRWSKPAQLVPHSKEITGYTSQVSVYPAAPKAEDSFWQQKALAAVRSRPAQAQITKTSVIDTYKQYLKEKYYD